MTIEQALGSSDASSLPMRTAVDIPRSTSGFMSSAFRTLWLDTPPPFLMPGPIHQDTMSTGGQLTSYPSGLISFSELDFDNMDKLFDGLPVLSEAYPSVEEMFTVPNSVATFKVPPAPLVPEVGLQQSHMKPLQRSVLDAIPAPVQALHGNGILSEHMPATNAMAQRCSSTVTAFQRRGGSSSTKGRAGRSTAHNNKDLLTPETLKTKPANCSKRTRMTPHFDKTEHILRERWRRDDLAKKYVALEHLLHPRGTKRDRNTIVADARILVKSLQHRKEFLKKRHSEMILAVTQSRQHPRGWLKSANAPLIISPDVRHCQVVPTLSNSGKLPIASKENVGNMIDELVGNKVKPAVKMTVPVELKNCVENLKIQSGCLTVDVIVLEMICLQIPRFQSTLFEALEAFGLEITSSNICRIGQKLMCNITVKPRHSFPVQIRRTTASIVRSLMSALRPAP